MNIEKWIKQIRKEANLSQAQLGEIISVNQNTISNYETGAREIDIDALMLLAKKFKYDVNINNCGITFIKNTEENITMCDWCMNVLDNKITEDDKCPYCGNHSIKKGSLKLVDGWNLIKRNREVVLCENISNIRTPYVVSILSAYNNGKYSLVHGNYFCSLDGAMASFNKKVEEYAYRYEYRIKG